LAGVASSASACSRIPRKSSGTESKSLELRALADVAVGCKYVEDGPHINTILGECSNDRVEVIPEPNIHITDLVLVHLASAPKGEGFKQFLDSHQQTGNSRVYSRRLLSR
jgi:hypothetical protein